MNSGGLGGAGDDRRDDEFSSQRARDRLSGALNSAVVDTTGGIPGLGRVDAHDLLDGIPDLTDGLDTPLKRIINSSSPWQSPTSKSPRQHQRRRRKKEAPGDAAAAAGFHHTFVMKLFDRSVDLAQFRADMPLYPVCRAWMKNQPHLNFAQKKKTEPSSNGDPGIKSPEVKNLFNGHDDNGDAADNDSGSKNGQTSEPTMETNNTESNANSSLLDPVRVDGDKRLKLEDEVLKLPEFQPLERDQDGRPVSVRVPEVKNRPEKQAFEIEQIQEDVSASDLLARHRGQWRAVRQSWRDANAANEDRYRDSMEVLKAMFQR